MITIDGSYGEGGGQMLRTCVALSAVTGEAFRIEDIRANRKNPGIRPQHLNAVGAVVKLCDADVEGLTVGSQELEFSPKSIAGGGISLNIGTAGSVTLVLQALMVPAMFARKAVRVRLTGGTDVRWSPTVDYLRNVTLPILGKFGYRAKIDLKMRGYYPVGGGQVEARIESIGGMDEIKLLEQGEVVAVGGVSHAHGDLEESRVARRQLRSARHTLYGAFANRGFKGDIHIKQQYVDASCYGSGITLWTETEDSWLGSSSIGERGKRAEAVGKDVAKQLLREINSKAPLDRHMGDQIVPYLALAGGRVRVSEVTEHTRTNVYLVNKFGFNVEILGDEIRAAGVS